MLLTIHVSEEPDNCMGVNVKDYGAVGDGSTDDAWAINAAIAAAASLGGGDVWHPPGIYQIEELIWVNGLSGIRLRGEGAASVIRAKSGLANHLVAFTGGSGNGISDLMLDHAGATIGHGLRIADVTDFTAERLAVINAFAYGIGAQAGTMKNVWLSQIRIVNAGDDGIDFKNPYSNNDGLFLSEIVVDGFSTRAGSGNAGIDMRGPAQMSQIVVNGVPSGCAGIKLREDGPTTGLGGERSSLTNFRVMGNSGASWGVAAMTKHVRIAGGFISGFVEGVLMLDGQGIATGNEIQNCTKGVRIKGSKAIVVGNRIIGCTTAIANESTGSIVEHNITA